MRSSVRSVRKRRERESKMRILVAENRGFCAGVRRAVNTALEIAPENTYVLGELVHNEEVTKRVAARGIYIVDGKKVMIK